MELGRTNSSCVLSCSMTGGLEVIKAQGIGDWGWQDDIRLQRYRSMMDIRGAFPRYGDVYELLR